MGGPEDERAPRWRRLGASALLVALVVLAFAPALEHGFLAWDDEANVSANPLLVPPSWSGVARFWAEPFKGLYAPLSYTVFALEAWIDLSLAEPARGLRLDATTFHAGSLLLHLACVLVVRALLARWSGSERAAWFGAALFAVHPLQVEPVAWVIETRGLLASLFSLLALWVWTAARGAALRYGLGTLCLALALLSKASAAATPLIAWVVAVGLLEQRPLRAARELAPWFALALAAGLATRALQPASSIGPTTALWLRPLVAGDALAFYLGKLVWPFGLVADYGRTPERALAGAWVWFAWIVPLALFAVRARAWRTALGVLVAGLAPVLGLVPFQYQTISTVADRYAHLAMLGPALALAWALRERGSRPLALACAAALLGLAFASRAQVAHWKDDTTLFERTLAANPESFPAHVNLGLAHLRAGRLRPAVEHLERAAELRPEDVRATMNLATALDRAGDAVGARRWHERSAELAPSMAEAHVNLGEFLLRQGEHARAAACFEHALELDPGLPGARNNLALVLIVQGRTVEAERELREVLRRAPWLPEAHMNLGRVLAAHGARDEALRHLREALRLRPGYSDALTVLRQMGEAP